METICVTPQHRELDVTNIGRYRVKEASALGTTDSYLLYGDQVHPNYDNHAQMIIETLTDLFPKEERIRLLSQTDEDNEDSIFQVIDCCVQVFYENGVDKILITNCNPEDSEQKRLVARTLLDEVLS